MLIDLGGGAAAARRLVPGADLRSDTAARRPTSTIRSACARLFAAHRELRDAGSCSRTTTAPTAACSRRCARWRSRRTAGSTSSSPRRAGRRRGAVQRGARRGRCRCAADGPAARAQVLARARPRARASVARVAAHERRRRSGAAARSCIDAPRVELQRKWSELTYRMQALRDDPQCAREEYDARTRRATIPASSSQLTFDPRDDVAAPYVAQRRAAAGRGAARAGREQPASRWPRRSTAPASRRTTCT